MSRTVGLITCRDFPQLDGQEQPLVGALEALGLTPKIAAWDDPEVRWEDFTLCLLRSPWDYFRRPSEFRDWLSAARQRARIFNPPDLILWNLHKQYLLELAEKGIPVVETELVRHRQTVDVAALAERKGWGELVIKPAIAAGAYRTQRHPPSARQAAQEHADAVLQDVDVLIQPYQEAVTGSGERSLIFFDGVFSHAARKRTAFELAPGSRAEVTAVEASEDEQRLAREVLSVAWPEPLLYARVDMIRAADGRPRLMELEVFEPSLYLRSFPPSAERFAQAIAKKAAALSA